MAKNKNIKLKTPLEYMENNLSMTIRTINDLKKSRKRHIRSLNDPGITGEKRTNIQEHIGELGEQLEFHREAKKDIEQQLERMKQSSNDAGKIEGYMKQVDFGLEVISDEPQDWTEGVEWDEAEPVGKEITIDTHIDHHFDIGNAAKTIAARIEKNYLSGRPTNPHNMQHFAQPIPATPMDQIDHINSEIDKTIAEVAANPEHSDNWIESRKAKLAELERRKYDLEKEQEEMPIRTYNSVDEYMSENEKEYAVHRAEIAEAKLEQMNISPDVYQRNQTREEILYHTKNANNARAKLMEYMEMEKEVGRKIKELEQELEDNLNFISKAASNFE